MKLSNSVANLNYCSNFRNGDTCIEVFNLFANDLVDLAQLLKVP